MTSQRTILPVHKDKTIFEENKNIKSSQNALKKCLTLQRQTSFPGLPVPKDGTVFEENKNIIIKSSQNGLKKCLDNTKNVGESVLLQKKSIFKILVHRFYLC